ncbi:glutathione S-transferase T2-like [Arachis duranensis]|uniref:Glutathione S-transferase T2-like n=1 Tax=Arachis duranensis TaxID=130453 RepID=A0A6P4C4D4_ARADU|nr:glutathione S-transferase T2-like [Arachis duranensis]
MLLQLLCHFANPRGLDAIDLNDDDIEDRRILLRHDKGVVACKKRWYKINKAVAQFAGCYDQASRNIRSGSNADDIKELAYKLYSTNYGQKFTFERHWNMLRLEQNWRSQLPTQSGGSKRTKVSATGAYSSSSNPKTPLADEPGVNSPVRPQGSKKSKQKGKGRAQMSEDFSERKSSVIKKLSLMEDIKNVRENELMDRKKEREEEKEHRAKTMAIKEKELQIQAAMKEQELQAQAAMKEQELQTQRHVFFRIVDALSNVYPYFQQRVDATGRRGLSPLQKCTAVIRMLAYGVGADAVDDYVHIGNCTTIECLGKFVEYVISVFEDEYLRKPKLNDVQRLLQMAEGRGFPGMLGSIDCMHWQWKNCPKAWKCMYMDGYRGVATIVLEIVASSDL